ncbi:MAG TPA: nitrous oxide reductase family maturation protein NosD [Gemmatimonadales bacterium]|nr:nitrous oxide reductase family maturation protein NosD [Gemmatimonadales bacterium]
MRTSSRIAVGVSALLLIALYFLPLWRIDLHAPQYPEGLGLRIRVDQITGQKPNDLNSINGLRADRVTIRGLTLRNVGPSYTEDRAGLRLEGVRGCTISDNRLEGTFFGIYAARSSGCTISGNVIAGHAAVQMAAGNAIHLFYSDGFAVTGNRISGHRDGIYLEFSPGARIAGNESHANLRYGLHFMYSDSCTYRDNAFKRNGAGVAVMYSRAITMAGNRFVESRGAAAYGLLLKEIKDAQVEGNRFEGNRVGLWVEGSDRIAVRGNEFVENGWAARLMADATGNTYLRNRFEGNSFDVATNSAGTSPGRFTENYWDRYTGYDLDRDGYGDVPHRPVRLFAILVEQHEPTLILLRSFFVDLLDVAERIAPVLTPAALRDERPLMRWAAS